MNYIALFKTTQHTSCMPNKNLILDVLVSASDHSSYSTYPFRNIIFRFKIVLDVDGLVKSSQIEMKGSCGKREHNFILSSDVRLQHIPF